MDSCYIYLKPKSFLPPTLPLCCRWVPALSLYFPPWPCMAPIPAPALLALRPDDPAHWPFAALRSGGFSLCLFSGGAVPFYINSSMCTPRLSRSS